jgi:hypothetical protein
MRIIGIDPGKSGGVSWTSACGRDRFAKGFRALTYPERGELLLEIATGQRVMAFIELVGARPTDGRSSAFKFGKDTGILEGMLMAHKIPLIRVTPGTWQRALGCLTKGDKKITRTRAQEWYPELKATHQTADAILIAEYGRRKYIMQARV